MTVALMVLGVTMDRIELTGLGDMLSTALAIVAIASLAGLGLIRGTVTNLRENLKDAREEIADKDRRLTDCDAERSRAVSDLAALQRVVTGEVHWVALGEQMTEHHQEALRHWHRAEDAATDVSHVLGEIRDELRDQAEK